MREYKLMWMIKVGSEGLDCEDMERYFLGLQETANYRVMGRKKGRKLIRRKE